MIKRFLRERLSWIILFLCLQLFIIMVSFLDSSIPLSSLLYIVYLSVIIFAIFLVIRYRHESRFFQSLLDWEHNLDVTSIPEAQSPFEMITQSMIVNQTEFFKQEVSKNQIMLEKEKDELLAWIHEVKTPLTAMQLMIDSMDEGPIKDKLAIEWLRIHHLLDQQLHQKRIPFIDNDLFIEKVELKSLIFKEIRNLQTWCMQKGIGFDVDIQSPYVLSDGKWLSFIIRQLLTNAVKYSEASDIMIKSYQKNEQTLLMVEDFGCGIVEKDIPRIFDKSFTSTNNHKEHSATGMGLYLAEKAASSLLIKIGVSSKPGEGTTFTLTFPKSNEFSKILSM